MLQRNLKQQPLVPPEGLVLLHAFNYHHGECTTQHLSSMQHDLVQHLLILRSLRRPDQGAGAFYPQSYHAMTLPISPCGTLTAHMPISVAISYHQLSTNLTGSTTHKNACFGTAVFRRPTHRRLRASTKPQTRRHRGSMPPSRLLSAAGPFLLALLQGAKTSEKRDGHSGRSTALTVQTAPVETDDFALANAHTHTPLTALLSPAATSRADALHLPESQYNVNRGSGSQASSQGHAIVNPAPSVVSCCAYQ